jgi:phage terminase large subunit
MSGHNAVTLLAGNPVRSSGYFFDVFNKPEMAPHWRRIHISCVDHPRVTPDFVADVARKYGEQSNAYRVRVLGEFPLADDDTVIPFELVETARTRDVTGTRSKEVWGLDVARFGSDRSALCRRRGNTQLARVESWQGLDTMEVAGRVVTRYEALAEQDRPEVICVDVIGIGAGVVDRLRELGLPVRGINVSEAPALGDKYRNLRTELWFNAREWLAARDCRLEDVELGAELTKPKYSFTSNGKIQLESKDDMKKRGERSPDLADAFVLTFAVPATTAAHGTNHRTAWGKPLRRTLKGIV